MRTQIRNDTWGWIIWLLILTLLNAIALGAGRSVNRGGDRSSSNSSQRSAQAQQHSQPARSQAQSAPSRSSQPAEVSVSRTQRSAPSRSAPQVTVSQERSASPSRRSSQSVSSQPQRQVAVQSRPVRHEVIVAPSSQSLDVSSSRTVTRTAPSITTAGNTARVGGSRTVEVKQVQSERSSSSTASTIRPARDRVTDTIKITAGDSGSSVQQGRASDSNRQPRTVIERRNQPQRQYCLSIIRYKSN